MCSRGCPYCYEKGKSKGEMPFEVLEHGFKTLKSLNVDEAELIGSEPTEYSRWDDLVKLAKEQNIDFIWITDGLGWHTTKRPLEETYNHNEYVFNLNMLESGVLNELKW